MDPIAINLLRMIADVHIYSDDPDDDTQWDAVSFTAGEIRDARSILGGNWVEESRAELIARVAGYPKPEPMSMSLDAWIAREKAARDGQ